MEVALSGILTLVADGRLALQAAGQVGRIGEHPGLARGRLAGRGRTEGSVATGPGCTGELAREVQGEGAQALLLVWLGAAPAGLLFDEGVGWRRRRRRSGRRRGTAQRPVSRGARRREVQHGRPLRCAAHREPAAAAAAAQRRHSGQQRVQVPHVGTHEVRLGCGRFSAPAILRILGAGLGPGAPGASVPRLLRLLDAPGLPAERVLRRRLRDTRGSRLLRQEEVQDRGEEAAGPGSWAAVLSLGGWVNEWVGGRAGKGKGEQAGGRVAESPGCGRCLELLTPAAWLPPASQSSNKRGRQQGRRRSQDARPLHSHSSPSLAQQSALLVPVTSTGGVGRARGSVHLGDTLLSGPPRALSWPVPQASPCYPSWPSRV